MTVESNLSLSAAFDYYILDRETFCSPRTIENYKNSLRYFIDYMEDSRQLPADQIQFNSITRLDIKKYVVFLRNKPLNQGHPFKINDDQARLTKRSVRNYCVDLRTFMNFMNQEGWIDDVMKGFRLIRSESREIVPLTASEVQRISSLFNPNSFYGIRNLCILYLMLDAGFRLNEVCELRLSHVLLDNRQFYIHFSKGDKERVVPMSLTLKNYLSVWLNDYRKPSDHDHVLQVVDGSPLSEAAVKCLFVRIRGNTGIERLKPHLLRHTFATSYILGGGSVELLRILLGHSSLETTQIYMHVAAVYDFCGDVYELDPIFFSRYYSRR